MKCCLEWVGDKQMGLGTDYAHRVGDPEGAIKAVQDLQQQVGLSQEQVDNILGKNFEKLFKLPEFPGTPAGDRQAAAAV
jgi:aminocarboxymuconate-semialdehyde decarboxylase